jgi:hypothetical protein
LIDPVVETSAQLRGGVGCPARPEKSRPISSSNDLKSGLKESVFGRVKRVWGETQTWEFNAESHQWKDFDGAVKTFERL